MQEQEILTIKGDYAAHAMRAKALQQAIESGECKCAELHFDGGICDEDPNLVCTVCEEIMNRIQYVGPEVK